MDIGHYQVSIYNLMMQFESSIFNLLVVTFIIQFVDTHFMIFYSKLLLIFTHIVHLEE